MRTEKAVIVGCLKNSAVYLPNVLNNIEKISDQFNQVSFIFIENDSTDDTKKIMNLWGAKQRDFKIYSLDGLDQYETHRTVRLEIARNAYLSVIQQNEKYHDYQYVIMIDMDDRGAYPIEESALQNALVFLSQKNERAAVFANQPTKYYDLWALRHPQLCPFDFWHEVMTTAFKLATDQEAFDAVYSSVLKSIPVENPPIQVESAFGGLGIYKMRYVLENKNRYLGREFKYFLGDDLIFSKLQTCEHVSFHRGIAAQGGQMFILPYLVNSNEDTGFNASSYRTLLIKK